MNKFLSVSLALLAVLLCLTFEALAENQESVVVIKDIGDYIKEHPGTKLTPLKKVATAISGAEAVRYTLGARGSGEQVVAMGAQDLHFDAKKDVSKKLSYPKAGSGKKITEVVINSLQDNVNGNAYVVSGGIGQRSIQLIFEAKETKRLTYNVLIFGSD